MGWGELPAGGARSRRAPPTEWPLDQLPPAGTGGWAGSIRVDGRGVEAAVRSREVRERGQERLVVLVHPVAERHLVALQEPGHDLDLDVHDVVAETAAVREAGEVAADHPEAVLVRRRRHAQVELERVDCRRALNALVLVEVGDALEQRLHDVRAVVLRRADREQRVQDGRELRLHDVLAVELRVAVRRGAVEAVLLTEGDDHLVDERVAQARHLDPAAAVTPAGRPDHLQPPALRRRPHADDGVVGVRSGHGLAVAA